LLWVSFGYPREASMSRAAPAGPLAAVAEPFMRRPVHPACKADSCSATREQPMNGIIYLIGLIVVIMAILSFLGLR
jgi:hypothetical protein